MFILLLICLGLAPASAKDLHFKKPNSKEIKAFTQYLKVSGLLRKKHVIKSLNPGRTFAVLRGACKDGDDIFVLQFEQGIDLELPEEEYFANYYPNGSGGARSLVIRHDPKTGYFQFQGDFFHRMPEKAVVTEKDCPDILVWADGTSCGLEYNALSCLTKLVYETWGYSYQDPPKRKKNKKKEKKK